MGLPETMTTILYVAMTLLSFACYVPVNLLGKRMGKKKLVLIGFCGLSLVYLITALSGLFGISGLAWGIAIVFVAAFPMAILGILPQAIVADIAQSEAMNGRETQGVEANCAGVICHTVKFCDYYGFEYSELKGAVHQPLLKIETDCTPASSGQLATRLDAFAETLGAQREQPAPTRRAHLVAGVDSGSTSTDAVIMILRTPFCFVGPAGAQTRTAPGNRPPPPASAPASAAHRHRRRRGRRRSPVGR